MEFKYCDEILDKCNSHWKMYNFRIYKHHIKYVTDILTNIEDKISIDMDSLSREELDTYPMEKQENIVINYIEYVFYIIVNRVITIQGTTLTLLRNEEIPDNKKYGIMNYVTFQCLGRFIYDKNLDIKEYIKSTLDKKFNGDYTKVYPALGVFFNPVMVYTSSAHDMIKRLEKDLNKITVSLIDVPVSAKQLQW